MSKASNEGTKKKNLLELYQRENQDLGFHFLTWEYDNELNKGIKEGTFKEADFLEFLNNSRGIIELSLRDMKEYEEMQYDTKKKKRDVSEKVAKKEVKSEKTGKKSTGRNTSDSKKSRRENGREDGMGL